MVTMILRFLVWILPHGKTEDKVNKVRRQHDKSALRPLNDWAVIVVASIELQHVSAVFAGGAVLAAIVMAVLYR
jgi:hypothetical protein